MKSHRTLPLLPLVAAGAIIACSGCGSRKAVASAAAVTAADESGRPSHADPSAVVSTGATDRGAIIASERRFDRNIVRDTADAPIASFPKGAAGSMPVQAIAKAVVYRMSGPYADHVAIALAPDGSVLSYPAPSDLSDNSIPLPLADGWYLSRTGITPSSVFLTYTIDSYRALPQAPAPSQLLEAVIPGAHVVELRTLNLTPAQAIADTAAVNRLIANP